MSEEKVVTPKKSWVSTETERAPWIRTKCAEVVLPPNDQDKPDITNEMVLQERAEPVGKSAAFPLNGGFGDKSTGGISAPSDGAGRGIDH